MIAFLDLETNGFAGSSVLQCAVIKKDMKMKDVGVFNRFYYSEETHNKGAEICHGLNPQIITERRDNSYPDLFVNDLEFEEFMSDVTHIVAHNTGFDLGFVKHRINSNIKILCTMKTNKSIVQALNKNGRIKVPKLNETARFYNIPFNEEDLHDALADIDLTTKVFIQMLKNREPNSVEFLTGVSEW